MAKDRQIQIRLEPWLYERVKKVIDITHTSFSEFTRLGLALAVEVYSDQEMYLRVYGSTLPLPRQYFEQFKILKGGENPDGKPTEDNYTTVLDALLVFDERIKKMEKRLEKI